jgi:methyltransferase-like protein
MTDQALTPAQNSYDEVPYPATAQTESHPNRLATLAALHGLTPPPVDHCRVLELGCSDGGNLISIAYGLPGSEFIGVDFSAREVATGQEKIARLGLKNIALQHLDILQVGQELGQFDYILACGIYSWVPAPVQERLLEICRQLLTSNGVAYINYNTYPGWYMRGMVRRMLLYHTRRLTDLEQRAGEARAILGFVADAAQAVRSKYASQDTDRSAYASILRQELSIVNDHPDTYLCHEHLEEHNEPLYFHEFMGRAARHGLQYLTEAEFANSQLDNLPPEVAKTVRALSDDLIEQEQYLDFVNNRTFRQTLLCHQNVELRRTFTADQLSDFWVASPVMPESEKPDLHSTAVEKFRSPRGIKLTASNPVAKAALLHLSEIWPQAIPFDQLLAVARARLASAGTPPIYSAERLAHDARGVGEMLLRSFCADLVELHLCPPHFETHVSERPAASLIARFQVYAGRNVINLRHEPITVDDELTYRLLPLLDGQHDQAALLARLTEMVESGDLVAQADNGRPYKDSAKIEATLKVALDRALHHLANAALLIA